MTDGLAMDLPKRTKQKRAEAHSYAILIYKLRELGIFRSLTDNDYGIDFELELVDGEHVSGRSVKIQVKSAERLRLREGHTPVVGGIKQTTLAYWCELSYRTNIIAYAVDLASETVYISKDLFWQASQEIDGGGGTKSIEFIPAGSDGELAVKEWTKKYAFAPSAADEIYAHTLALRRWRDVLQIYVAASDEEFFDMELQEEECFIDFLKAARILMWQIAPEIWDDDEQTAYWWSYEYWVGETNEYRNLTYSETGKILEILLPPVHKILRHYRTRVLNGKYYWAHRNYEYLVLVYAEMLADTDDMATLVQWCNGPLIAPTASMSDFLKLAHQPAPAKGYIRTSRLKPHSRSKSI